MAYEMKTKLGYAAKDFIRVNVEGEGNNTLSGDEEQGAVR
jgi:hypothetical protein